MIDSMIRFVFCCCFKLKIKSGPIVSERLVNWTRLICGMLLPLLLPRDSTKSKSSFFFE